MKNILEFAAKKQYLVNWFLVDKTIKEVERELKDNEIKKRKFFVLNNKIKKWEQLTHAEKIDIQFNLKDIVW